MRPVATTASYRHPVSGDPDLKAVARLTSLLRVLLLALAVGLLVLLRDGLPPAVWGRIIEPLRWLLGTVGVVTLGLVIATRWVQRSRTIFCHLGFDLLWITLLIHHCGGVQGPAAPLLFAPVLVGVLAMPGVWPYALSTAAIGLLMALAVAHLAGIHPLVSSDNGPWTGTWQTLGRLVVQAAALFLVDFLGQHLARRLREERILVADLLNQLGEGVVALDLQGRIAWANVEAHRLVGCRLPLGHPLLDALPPALARAVRSLLGRSDLPALEAFHGDDDHHLLLRLTRLCGRGGRQSGLTLGIVDQTRLRSLEEDAARSERLAALGTMAAGIAHEVRNPLASLRGCAQELGSMAETGSDADRLSRIMVEEADRLCRTIEDFLTFSRLRPPSPEPLPPRPALERVADLARRRPDWSERLSLLIEVDPDCPPLLVDPDHLRQVLINLVANAIEALTGPAPGRILLAARRLISTDGLSLEGPGVLLSVHDNGPGIPESVRVRLFTPFYSTKSRGTGLGLSLVQRMVHDNHGLVRIDGRPGSGTLVRIALPAADLPAR